MTLQTSQVPTVIFCQSVFVVKSSYEAPARVNLLRILTAEILSWLGAILWAPLGREFPPEVTLDWL